MTPDRAQEIVTAINNRCLFKLDLVEPHKLGSLEGVSLAEMLEAKEVIETGNREAEARAKAEGDGYSIKMIPDDRLIAAAYVLEHYHPDTEAIVVKPTRIWPYDRLAVGVVGLQPGEGEEEA